MGNSPPRCTRTALRQPIASWDRSGGLGGEDRTLTSPRTPPTSHHRRQALRPSSSAQMLRSSNGCPTRGEGNSPQSLRVAAQASLCELVSLTRVVRQCCRACFPCSLPCSSAVPFALLGPRGAGSPTSSLLQNSYDSPGLVRRPFRFPSRMPYRSPRVFARIRLRRKAVRPGIFRPAPYPVADRSAGVSPVPRESTLALAVF